MMTCTKVFQNNSCSRFCCSIGFTWDFWYFWIQKTPKHLKQKHPNQHPNFDIIYQAFYPRTNCTTSFDINVIWMVKNLDRNMAMNALGAEQLFGPLEPRRKMTRTFAVFFGLLKLLCFTPGTYLQKLEKTQLLKQTHFLHIIAFIIHVWPTKTIQYCHCSCKSSIPNGVSLMVKSLFKPQSSSTTNQRPRKLNLSTQPDTDGAYITKSHLCSHIPGAVERSIILPAFFVMTQVFFVFSLFLLQSLSSFFNE